MTEELERHLAAIMALDIAGYSRLIGADEAGTLIRLRRRRQTIFDPLVAEHRGRVVKGTGDGVNIAARLESEAPEAVSACPTDCWGLLDVRNDWFLEPIRKDPRYAAFVAKLDFP